jgi:succinate dehydrogenase / fumarate reductase iron-sulfur subunit
MSGKVNVNLRVKRYNPETDTRTHWDDFEIEAEPTDRVLDVLHTAKWLHDGTISFRRSCAHGVCGSDAMMINGANGLACIQLVKDVGTTITLEPIRGLPVIKDLVVDMEPFFAQYRKILPYLISSSDPGYSERSQTPEQRARYDDTTKCILCACCTTSCPVYWANGDYLGPAAIVNAHRFIFDSRDDAGKQRLDILSDKSGVFRCRTSMNCTESCPRDIKVTQAIEEVRREILTNRV